MRRRSATVSQADELFGADLDRASALDPEKVIAQLEPLVTPERRQRLLGTIDLRLDSVAAVMDSPHDPHNGAAVMRSCDAFGVQRLHVLARRESFVVATSVAKGSHKWVDVVTHTTAASVRDAMESSGHELVAAEASGELAPDDLATIPRFALVLGNEREGIGADLPAPLPEGGPHSHAGVRRQHQRERLRGAPLGPGRTGQGRQSARPGTPAPLRPRLVSDRASRHPNARS